MCCHGERSGRSCRNVRCEARERRRELQRRERLEDGPLLRGSLHFLVMLDTSAQECIAMFLSNLYRINVEFPFGLE